MFFEYTHTEADSLGMIHFQLEMYRIRKEIVSLDGEQAYELYASYLNKKRGKKAILKHFDFVSTVGKTKRTDFKC